MERPQDVGAFQVAPDVLPHRVPGRHLCRVCHRVAQLLPDGGVGREALQPGEFAPAAHRDAADPPVGGPEPVVHRAEAGAGLDRQAFVPGLRPGPIDLDDGRRSARGVEQRLGRGGGGEQGGEGGEERAGRKGAECGTHGRPP